MLLTEIGSTSLPEFMNTDEDASEHTLHNQEGNRCALIDCVGMQIKTVNDLGGFLHELRIKIYRAVEVFRERYERCKYNSSNFYVENGGLL